PLERCARRGDPGGAQHRRRAVPRALSTVVGAEPARAPARAARRRCALAAGRGPLRQWTARAVDAVITGPPPRSRSYPSRRLQLIGCTSLVHRDVDPPCPAG